jgi:hypothetical protein
LINLHKWAKFCPAKPGAYQKLKTFPPTWQLLHNLHKAGGEPQHNQYNNNSRQYINANGKPKPGSRQWRRSGDYLSEKCQEQDNPKERAMKSQELNPETNYCADINHTCLLQSALLI